MQDSSEKLLIITLISAIFIGILVLIFDKEYRIPAIIASNSTYYAGVTDKDIKEHAAKYTQKKGYKKSYKKYKEEKKKEPYKTFPKKMGAVNINTALKAELEKVPGITSSIATKIIFYRKIHKGFKDKNELKKIPGISTEKYNLMQKFLKL
ncbi:MAG: helix-hairpin-helix domain-containing protein [Spirochaetes bacterium]|nr:helix-hairpin-helix domain-containing protein [Spirochaetota bacterium]